MTSTVVQKIKPFRLKKNDTIGIVGPASPISEDELLRITTHLHNLGFSTKVAENVLVRTGVTAGSDRFRAEEFMRLWLDPNVSMLWGTIGGFGSTRILPMIDWEKLLSRPKIFLGMSDLCSLHNPLLAQNHVCFLGTNLRMFLGKSKILPEQSAIQGVLNLLLGKEMVYDATDSAKTLSSGVVTAPLVGGNLTMLVTTIGTPYQADTKDKILLIEEVQEQPFRIDRMLTQLEQAGLLSDLKGVILASFRRCDPKVAEMSYSLVEMLQERFSNVEYPVLLGFPSGHIERQVTLPLGVDVELDADKKIVKIVESPFSN